MVIMMWVMMRIDMMMVMILYVTSSVEVFMVQMFNLEKNSFNLVFT